MHGCICSRPSGADKEFFLQLFVGPDENVPMPDTYWLLHKMFKDLNITFKEVICYTYLVTHTYRITRYCLILQLKEQCATIKYIEVLIISWASEII